MRASQFLYQQAVYLLAAASLLSFLVFGVALNLRLASDHRRAGLFPAASVLTVAGASRK